MPRDHLTWDELEAERLLVELRPRLGPERQARIEHAHFGTAPARRPQRGRRRLALGGALAAGIAALAFVLGTLGGLPLVSGDDPVAARDDCVRVAKRVPVRLPVQVRQPDGTVALETRTKTVTRWVKRCR